MRSEAVPHAPNEDSHYCKCRGGLRQVAPAAASQYRPARRVTNGVLVTGSSQPQSMLAASALGETCSSKQTAVALVVLEPALGAVLENVGVESREGSIRDLRQHLDTASSTL